VNCFDDQFCVQLLDNLEKDKLEKDNFIEKWKKKNGWNNPKIWGECQT